MFHLLSGRVSSLFQCAFVFTRALEELLNPFASGLQAKFLLFLSFFQPGWLTNSAKCVQSQNSIFYRGEIGLAGASVLKLRSILRIPQQLWTTFCSEDFFLLLVLILIMMNDGLAWLGCQLLSLKTKPGHFGFLKKSDLSPSMVLFSTGFVDCGFCH